MSAVVEYHDASPAVQGPGRVGPADQEAAVARRRIPPVRAQKACAVAFGVVIIELGAISCREAPWFRAALQVMLGRALVFVTGILIGQSWRHALHST